MLSLVFLPADTGFRNATIALRALGLIAAFFSIFTGPLSGITAHVARRAGADVEVAPLAIHLLLGRLQHSGRIPVEKRIENNFFGQNRLLRIYCLIRDEFCSIKHPPGLKYFASSIQLYLDR
jgi:hypothetical protein